MERHSIHEYMHIGAINWHLVRLPDGVRARGESSASSAISSFERSVTKAGLSVTRRAGLRLWAICEELEKLQATALVPANLLDEIRSEAKFLERTLVAEAEGKKVFVVTEKRIDINKLLNLPASLLSKDVWGALPKISAGDFAEGCKAIAFELPTAGAFFLLRAVEGALLNYYLCAITNKRLPGRNRTWGPMVQQLRDRKKGRPPELLLNILDQIRVSFRNPTSHPEKTCSSDEVQDLFGLCVDALNRMVQAPGWKTPKDSFSESFAADLKELSEGKAAK